MSGDARVRELFLKPAGKWAKTGLFAGLVLFHLILCMGKQFALTSGPAAHLGTALLLTIPFGIMLVFAFRAMRNLSLTDLLLGGGICLAAMLLRLSFIDRYTGDYEYYLEGWLKRFAGQSFSDSMRMQVGEYHVLYQYILYLITRLPFPWLYQVKAVSFIGDALLAGAAFRLMTLSGRTNARGLIVLLLPAVALNGGMYAQCDSLYTAALSWGLLLILERKPGPGMACMGAALCLKLQAVFLFPLLPLLYLKEKIRLRDLIPFAAAVLLIQLPAVLGGKSSADLVGIYLNQTGLYTELNYGCPNLWALLVSTGLDGYAYGTFGIALAMGGCFLLMAALLHRQRPMTGPDWVLAAAVMTLLVVFFLPRMHERYTYPAEILTCFYAICDRRAIPAAAALSLANLFALWTSAIPLWGGAVLLLLGMLTLLMLLFPGSGDISEKHA